MGTLKLSNFWSSQVQTKTKAQQMMEQRLFTLQLSKGTLKLSDFWFSQGQTKSSAEKSWRTMFFLRILIYNWAAFFVSSMSGADPEF